MRMLGRREQTEQKSTCCPDAKREGYERGAADARASIVKDIRWQVEPDEADDVREMLLAMVDRYERKEDGGP